MKDILGRNVEEGDYIVKGGRRGSSGYLVVYKVINVSLTRLCVRSVVRTDYREPGRLATVDGHSFVILPPNWIPEDID